MTINVAVERLLISQDVGSLYAARRVEPTRPVVHAGGVDVRGYRWLRWRCSAGLGGGTILGQGKVGVFMLMFISCLCLCCVNEHRWWRCGDGMAMFMFMFTLCLCLWLCYVRIHGSWRLVLGDRAWRR